MTDPIVETIVSKLYGTKKALPCIVCGKELTNSDVDIGDGKIVNQPYAGTTFRTHGHYGSTVFDPMMHQAYLEINICDECLTKAAEEKKVLYDEPQEKIENRYEFWNPTDPNTN